jgi:hypothetical protein
VLGFISNSRQISFLKVENGYGEERMAEGRFQGIQLAALDRFMRRPYAVAVVAGVAVAFNVTMMFMNSGFTWTATDEPVHRILLALLGLAVLSSPWIVAAWWTVYRWRRLWRRGRGDKEWFQYNGGVRTGGVIGTVFILLLCTYLGWQNDNGELFGPMMTLGVLGGLLVGTPFFLDFGYWLGTTLAHLEGIEADPRVERGEPPPVSQADRNGS